MPCPDNLGTVGSNPTRSAIPLACWAVSRCHLSGGTVESLTQVSQQEHGVEQFPTRKLRSGRVVGADSHNFGRGEDYELEDFALQGLTQVLFC